MDSKPSSLGFHAKYILNLWCILFHPTYISLIYFAILSKIFSAYHVMFLMVKIICHENQNKKLYIASAQILLEIQQKIWKYPFTNHCLFVRKMTKCVIKTKLWNSNRALHVFTTISWSFPAKNFTALWAKETYGTSMETSNSPCFTWCWRACQQFIGIISNLGKGAKIYGRPCT